MKTQKTVPQLRFPGFIGDWEAKKLGEVAEFKVTNSYSREYLNYENGTVKNIHYGDIHTKFSTLFDITKEKVPFIDSLVNLEKIHPDNFCKEGDLIFADASEDLNDVGKSIEIVNLNSELLLSGLHTLLARPKKNIFRIGFKGYLFKSKTVRTQIQKEAQGSKVLSINVGRISTITISFPTLPEQEKIANFLTAVDEKLKALKKKKTLLEEYKKGIMQRIFSQKLRFLDDNGKPFPAWEMRKLGEVMIEFIVPMRDKPKKLDGEIPWCRIEDFNGKYLESSKTNQGVSLETIKQMNLKVYPVNTLLVSCSANLGICAITKLPLITNQTFIGLVPNHNIVNVVFMYYLMSTLKNTLNALSSGTTITYLSKNEFEILSILVPKTLPEQEKIAKFLSAIGDKIAIVQKEIEKVEEWKRGLLQRMFV